MIVGMTNEISRWRIECGYTGEFMFQAGWMRPVQGFITLLRMAHNLNFVDYIYFGNFFISCLDWS
jgi:hypothetical protein